MLNPIKDIFNYTLMFQRYLGKTIYVIVALGFFAAVFEGFGILMMLPLLESLDENTLPQAEGTINHAMGTRAAKQNFDAQTSALRGRNQM